jgi:hypothetical protein
MIGCSCDFGIDCEFYHFSIQRARKTHKCCECGDTINPGEKYECVTCKGDGHLDRFKTCMPWSAVEKIEKELGWT